VKTCLKEAVVAKFLSTVVTFIKGVSVKSWNSLRIIGVTIEPYVICCVTVPIFLTQSHYGENEREFISTLYIKLYYNTIYYI
jgi:hypothetical protein